MFPRALKGVVVLALSGLVAIFMGSLIGHGDHDSLVLLSYLGIAIFMLTAPGYLPLLALGLLNPIVVPLPFVSSFPFLAVMLGFCGLKLIFRDVLTHTEFRAYKPCLTPWFVAFFGWVAFRYLLKPVMPNLSGFGSSITGFRSYLSYAICFGVVMGLPFFIKTREDVLKLFRWMAGISCVFIIILIPMVFSKSVSAALLLHRFGVTTFFFDNGWLRVLALPGFGLTLLTLTLCPNLLPISTILRRCLFFLGLAAIVMGGTRSSAAMAVVIVLLVFLLRLQFFRLCASGAALAVILVAGGYMVETLNMQSGFGFMRILALTSSRVARQTDASSTWEWRQVLWERALSEIKKQPILGKGYGGLENAWVFSTYDQYMQVEGDINLAAGGIHNGFISSAYALGIPATLLFLGLFCQVLWRSARQQFSVRERDPVLAEMHQFVIVNLISLVIAIFIGTDLNGPIIWFYLTLGLLFTRIGRTELQAEESVPMSKAGFNVASRAMA
jgi:O-antigen ligase